MNVEGPRFFRPPVGRSYGIWWLLRGVFTPPREQVPAEMVELIYRMDTTPNG